MFLAFTIYITIGFSLSLQDVYFGVVATYASGAHPTQLCSARIGGHSFKYIKHF